MKYAEMWTYYENTAFCVNPESNRIFAIIEKAGRDEYSPTLYLTLWYGFNFWLQNRNIVIKATPFFNKNAEKAELRAELKFLLRLFPKAARLRTALLPPIGFKLELVHFADCGDILEAISETRIEYFPL